MARTARVASGRWLIVLLFGIAAFAALVLFAFRVYVFPTRMGTHRAFFRACLDVPVGRSPREVLRQMRGYALSNGSEYLLVTPDLVEADVEPTPDIQKESESNFLFLPAPQEIANWCVVVFRDGRVARTWISPD